ncbi:MAG TPA: CRTAC1 family protein [Steroidobacteraceae bacterium]|nr:CRTAC1 family protein [Steroidobacteraceae bacterium]
MQQPRIHGPRFRRRPFDFRARPARALALMAALALTSAPAVNAQIAFTDQSAFSGVDRSGESYGASWGDLNGDGYPDLFASNHRQQPSLYLNLKNGRFYETAAEVLPWRNRSRADTHGASWADIDNDGDQDLLVSTGTGNLSQLLINEHQRLVERTLAWGLTNSNVGGRLPVWLDYDNNKLPDFVMTQYGGVAKLYRQGPAGQFTDATTGSNLLCIRFHYAQLLDVNNDGALDFVCSGEASFPQKIYDVGPSTWRKIYDAAAPAAFLPLVRQTVDSVLADFNNDGRLDLFVLGGSQLRPSGVTQSSSTHFESQLAGGIKGFKFVTSGKVKFDIDWNKQSEVTGVDLKRIEIGANGVHPTGIPFTLDPANTNVRGMPPKPTTQTEVPVMQIGYDAVAKRWTLILWSQLTETSQQRTFSEAYLSIDSTASITGLAPTGLWTSDLPAKPTLLTNYSGGFVDETVRANLDEPVQCVSATAGDLDNDMDVDLYLACRGAASNIPNIVYENLGNGTFRTVSAAGGAAGPVGIAVRSGAGTADSAVIADYNVDGFLDLLVTNGFNLRPLGFGGVNKLFRNKGNGKRWIQLDLVGRNSDADATGARIYATAGGVRQLRIQNGAYHRWSQDLKRAHFGLAGATTVDLRVEWPSGSVQTFNDVATNKVYQVTEGVGIVPAKIGTAPAYQCGPPPLNGATDKGVFVWRDCPSGEWRLRTAAAGGEATYSGTITSGAAYTKVQGIALSEFDQLDYTSNPKQVKFTFQTKGSNLDGVNFLPQDKLSACVRITAPAGSKVYYGPFRVPLTQPLNLDLRTGC